MKHNLMSNWRGFFARLPLPMLALAASYGVFRFASLFVPFWVAVVQAAAFECTYVGLALVEDLEADERKRARAIGVGAVIVSILYNSLDGFFHRRPEILANLPLWFDITLALLHGAPLAWVSYLVANLLLHKPPRLVSNNASQSDEMALVGGRKIEYTVDDMLDVFAGVERIQRKEVVEQLGCSPATASKLIAEAVEQGVLKKNGVGYLLQP